MKYNQILFSIVLIFSSLDGLNHETLPQEVARGCLGLGFFAEVIWVFNFLEFCNATNRTPAVYWDSRSSYYSPEGYNGSINAWEYYFEPVSPYHYKVGDTIVYDSHFDRPSCFWDYYEYITNKNLCSHDEMQSFKQISFKKFPIYVSYPHGDKHLYNEQFREYIHKQVIDKYIKIKPVIQKKIEDFYIPTMKNKKTIGIHLRGTHIYGEVPIIPITDILKEANAHAGPGVQFFVATDQNPLLEQAKRELNGPVIYYECQRFDKTTSPIPGDKLEPRLGEYVLIEAVLLSLCDHFIHTISNVSTAVLYFNPKLQHTVLY